MGVCDLPAVSAVCGSVGEAAAAVALAPFEWLAAALGETAGWVVSGLWTVIDTTTRVDVTSEAYVAVYNLLFGVAVSLMLLLFLVQVTVGALRRDPTALVTATVGLGKAMVGSFVVISVTGLLLEVTDQLAVGIVAASGTSMEQMGDRLAVLVAGLAGLQAVSPTVGVIMTTILAGLAIMAAMSVWATLLVRKAVLLVAIVLAPVALSGLVWSATRDWFRRWASLVLALIVSKLVVVVVLLVATAQVSAPIGADLASIGDPIAGIVLLFVAAFAPYLSYKFIAFAGVDVGQAVSVEQDAKGAVSRGGPARLAGAAGRTATRHAAQSRLPISPQSAGGGAVLAAPGAAGLAVAGAAVGGTRAAARGVASRTASHLDGAAAPTPPGPTVGEGRDR